MATGLVHAVATESTETACGMPTQRMYRLSQAWTPENGARGWCQDCAAVTTAQ